MEIVMEEESVKENLTKLNIRKTRGPDDLPPMLLKAAAASEEIYLPNKCRDCHPIYGRLQELRLHTKKTMRLTGIIIDHYQCYELQVN